MPRLIKNQHISGVMHYMHWLAKLADITIIYLTGMVTFWAYFGYPIWQWERYQWMSALSSLMAVFLFNGCGVYQSWRGALRTQLLWRLGQGFIYLAGMIVGYLYLMKAGHHFSRLWFGIWLSCAFVICIMARVVAYWLLQRMRISGRNVKTLALIGSNVACRKVFRSLRRDPLAGFLVRHIRLLDADEALFNEVDDVRRFNPEKDGELSCHEIWICLHLSESDVVGNILNVLRYSTANIRFIPDLRSLRLLNYQGSYVVGHYALDISISPMHGSKRVLKWLEDKIVASLALLVLSPILLLVAVWIRIVSGRPIFYYQERVSWNGSVFKIIKFRTMPINNEKTGAIWGHAQEKETIPLGRWLRRLSIDELPQFWNVLKGEMSVVGPRPERPQFVEQFKNEIPGYMQKHMVKAGITGWAQVNGWRGDTDLEERINYDLWYIENWSLWLDLKIIFLTALRVFHDNHAH
ncbi:MAG: undecaprenyl-phosphate glucose phosphotransferase [Cardiobacteriaceae bacterium]|nr:undecaprenyl-phosphate glucose phosphotransferase [Cardiobacteriaceae bacterium]